MSLTCAITFINNPNKTFYSGDLIRGNVRLVLAERKKVRGVYVIIKGDATTEWTEYESKPHIIGGRRTMRQVAKRYKSHKTYLNWKVFFVGSNNGEMYLEPGEHVWNFTYRLPIEIPSTFHGEYGEVSYEICVGLSIPWWFDRKFTKFFTVIKRVDLSDHWDLHTPIIRKKEHIYYPCCFLWCYPSKPLKIVAKMPVGGYIPGEVVKLALTADNESDRKIPNFKIELKKDITYFAQDKEKSETVCLFRGITTRGVDTNQKKDIGLEFRIPSCAPSDDNSCSIIKNRYYLEIKSDSGAICNKPKMVLPIKIGTHPINKLGNSAATNRPNRAKTNGSGANNFVDRTEGPAIPILVPAAAAMKPSAPANRSKANLSSTMPKRGTVNGNGASRFVDPTEGPAVPILVPASTIQPSAPPKCDLTNENGASDDPPNYMEATGNSVSISKEENKYK